MTAQYLQAKKNHLWGTNLQKLALTQQTFGHQLFKQKILMSYCRSCSVNFGKFVQPKWFCWACRKLTTIAVCLQNLHFGSKRPSLKRLFSFFKVADLIKINSIGIAFTLRKSHCKWFNFYLKSSGHIVTGTCKPQLFTIDRSSLIFKCVKMSISLKLNQFLLFTCLYPNF